MLAVEIVLIIAGVLCICISFFVSKKRSDTSDPDDIPRGAEVWTEKDEEVIIKHIDEILERRGMELVETTEDQMNRICNEKIMAIDEFTKPLLEKINVNHEEVVFMYNMLNEKQKELKETIMEDTVRRSVPVIEPVQAEPLPEDPVEPYNTRAVSGAFEPAEVQSSEIYAPVEPVRTVETFTAPASYAVEEPVMTAPEAAASLPANEYADAIISATEANQASTRVSAERPAATGSAVNSAASGNPVTKRPVIDRSAATGLQRLGAAPPEPIPGAEPKVLQAPGSAPSEAIADGASPDSAPVPEPEPVVKYAEEPSHIEKNGGIEDRVHALYRAGKSVVDISKELNIGQGEVKLMIAMYKKRH